MRKRQKPMDAAAATGMTSQFGSPPGKAAWRATKTASAASRRATAGVTEAFTTQQAKAIFDTNVIGLLRVTCAVLPSMRQQHDGLIINIGSILGRVTFPFVGIYGASKFAVEALTDSLRYEVSRLGVEVVEVQPSGYPTNFFANSQTPAGTDVAEAYGEAG